MDQGHIDQISRQAISGWAADLDHPNDAVDVVIVVNGQKVTQVVCNRPREDLRNKVIYGSGRHGFHYEFDPPLSEQLEARIAVRFAASGEPVSGGDAVLGSGSDTPLIVASPTHALTLPAPTSPNMLFRLLRLLDPRQGLYPLLYRLNFEGIRPYHLQYAVFGQTDTTAKVDPNWTTEAARDLLSQLLSASKFQHNILAYALRAFPEKRRLLFVHIPKCAGSDLSLHLSRRYPALEEYLRDERRASKARFFETLAEFARDLDFSDSVFAVWRGHVPLDYFVEEGLIRPSDRVFAIVRSPIEIAVSAVNYLLTRFEQNMAAGTMEPDIRDWLRLLGMTSLPAEITPQFIIETSHRALHIPEIVQPNSLCYWLGGGDADAVIARLAQYHVEITDTSRYNEWLKQEWDVSSRTRENVSTKYVSLSMLGHKDLAHIRALSPEDQKLYDHISARLASSGKCSVVGEELA